MRNVAESNMATARTILRIVGAIGIWAWPFLCGLAWLFHDFKPGGAQGGLTTVQGWLCALAPTVAFIYYRCVAEMRWTKRLFAVGVLAQFSLLLSVIVLVSATDGGFLVAPFLLVGPVVWVIYWRKLEDGKQVS
jgi:hypothetical protein